MLKIVGNGVDHSYFVIKANDVIKVREVVLRPDIRLRNAQSHLPILSDHGIGA